ncbi:macro domain-containing protein [Intestinibacter bartlettii]|uniref:Macro domain-containing protein n=1 Tax=Intestinibacter bartlettii TaxID=261299 RepID=A0ABS6DUW1_9FIRM|nr:macro domain-containing protein [Intestinibacter bartlettii]MBU5335042.1 macro domain-containing protein [Intestinibacter bartlettii]
MPFEIIRQDITNMKTDVIVNPINSKLQLSDSGVCGSILKKAGIENLQNEYKTIGNIKTSNAVITNGYDLECKYIIHTVGPIWNGGKNNESTLLYNTYINCLNLAKSKNCESISFPLISSGNFGYPKDEALEVATSAIKDFLSENDLLIYLVVFDIKSFKIKKDLFDSITQYIDDNYVATFKDTRIKQNINEEPKPIYEFYCEKSLLDALENTEDTFSQCLFKLIDESGLTDAQVYKKANIDRRLFSKIRNNKDYTPSKSTILSLSIALELDINKTKDLLKKAGFALSHSNKFDIIVEYFISNKIYDIYTINEALFSFEQNILRT